MAVRDDKEEIDSQLLLENVAFLDKCFDCSFLLQNSLVSVKEFVTEEQTNHKTKLSTCKRNDTLLFNKTQAEPNLSQTLSQNIVKFSQRQLTVSKKLSAWGVPQEIVRKYESRGITEMFDWQVSCLSNKKVIMDNFNLVYSAPTSAGKTLVAEILTIKTVLERQKKVIFILPFVSIVREKTNYLQDILSSSGIRVEGFMGSQSPPGGLSTVHIAICTIEKANSLVNKLLDEGNISDLGAIVVDELHLLGDTSRGYILELLLTKVKFVTSKFEDTVVQIVGMSATLPNLNILSTWLEAELFITQFRPIPLEEYCLIEKKYFDRNGINIGKIDDTELACYNNDLLLKLCLDTIKEGCSILIFCMTKNRCENLAQTISSSFYKMGCSGSDLGIVLRKQLNTELILEVLEHLKNCPVGLDQVLKNTISFGVAYHHAGLTFDERDIIEAGFRNGSIRVLVATSTLSSGVNLPARKVVIRSPMFQRQPISIMTYKQMIGRAGRMGKDTKGESILLCTEAESKVGLSLMKGDLESVKSCINRDDKFMRAVLEIIASGIASTFTELELYCKCTLLSVQDNITDTQASLLQTTLDELKSYELIRTQADIEGTKYYATLLGKACLSSSMAPNDGLSLFCELQRARQCLVLETDLHLIYLVTPYSVSCQWGDIDWLHLLTLWESLTRAMKKVGELVGVQESFIIRCVRGTGKQTNVQNKVNIHKRFYTALALQDLVNEVPLHEVASKFRCARGFLQSLQQAAATFAGMVTVFCHQLGWKNMEILISQFQDRLHFGIHSELLELMKLPSLNGIRARSLYDSGFETLTSIASGETNLIENALLKSLPFQSEVRRDNDDDNDIRKRNKIKNVWVTGSCGITVKEAASNLIKEARYYLENELGVTDINWKNNIDTENKSDILDVKDVLKANDYIDNDDKDSAESKLTINKEIITQITEEKAVLANSTDEIHKLEFRCNLNNEIKVKDENISVKHETNSSFDILSEEIDSTQFKPNVCLDIVSNYIVKEEESFDNTKQKTEMVSKIDKNEIIKVIESNFKSSSPIVDTIKSKEIIEWETLNLSDNILHTHKERISEGIFTPEVSFNEEIKVEISQKQLKSQKDISLFSTDGENSSIFEDSFPVDAIHCKLLDVHTKSLMKSEVTNDILTINSNSLLNAFKTTLGSNINNNNSVLDDDEDIKLVYEDDSDVDTRKSVNKENIFIKNSVKITNKRENLSINSDDDQPALKRAKTFQEIKSNKSNGFENQLEKLTVTLPNKKEKILYHIKENKHLSKIESLKHVSIYLNLEKHKTITEIIGSNILNQNEIKLDKTDVKESRIQIKGISIYAGCDEIYYLDIENSNNYKEYLENIGKWLRNKSLRVVLLSTRFYLLKFIEYLNMELPTSCLDVCVAEWLINSNEKEPSLSSLAKKYCYVDINNVKSSNVLEETCMKCWAIWEIAEKQVRSLENLFPDYGCILDLETKISIILSRCEHIGLNIDKELVSKMLIEVKNTQEIIQKKAYKVCGYHFNFNSSKDVAKVLGIYRGRKVSTKKSVLTSHNSPMSSIIIFWRKLNSILTKTLYPLTEKAFKQSEDNRIHPSYTTFTCTGRVSMHEPNLQNVPRTFAIPIKYLNMESRITFSEETKEFNCRDIFKASAGYVLVSADYCQLEMRILTHYCGDDGLMRIMKSDDDVFKLIAAEWGDVDVNQVDDDLRQKAKQLCYGIIYGMGNKTLSQQLDVTEMEAAIFMDSFHKSYPSIKVFTASVIEGCKKRGYIETLMKRRRYLPDINSRVVSKRNTAERQAVNTTIQGSAADIAKSAMCSIDNRINLLKSHIQPRLLLQMHDELIYEVPCSVKNEFINILRYEMENTVSLKVPLPVRLKSGPSWGSLLPL